jgi:hypothetical protein
LAAGLVGAAVGGTGVAVTTFCSIFTSGVPATTWVTTTVWMIVSGAAGWQAVKRTLATRSKDNNNITFRFMNLLLFKKWIVYFFGKTGLLHRQLNTGMKPAIITFTSTSSINWGELQLNMFSDIL